MDDLEAADASALPPRRIGAPFRILRRRFASELQAMIDKSDLADAQNFHDAMAMIVGLGVSQSRFAEWRGFRASTVSRWVSGAKAPPEIRRAPIIRDAMQMLRSNIDFGEHSQESDFGTSVEPLFPQADGPEVPAAAVGSARRR